MSDEIKTAKYLITDSLAGERIDKGLSALIDYVSRTSLQKKIKDGKVTVNGKNCKASTILAEGDNVEIVLEKAEEPNILPEDIPLDILYEDRDVLVVNKPKNMVVHPSAGHYSGTLVNAVMYHCKDSLSGINGVLRPGIVHRIDMNTTGSVIICKNDNAHISIANQLKEHSINRRYLAIVTGKIKDDEGTIESFIGRDPKDRKKMAVTSSGKHAVTHYKVIERFDSYTYVECVLETGRTHQIRVHMASIGHPLLGDSVYGRESKNFKNLEGQCLHAYILGFVHPSTGEYIETTAKIPEYFEDILMKLRK